MQNITELSLRDIAGLTVNQKLILQGIDWDLYEKILDEFQGSNGLHFAYDDGFLEVEVPLAKHEIPIRLLSDLISIICLEKDIDVKNVGSTTFRKRAKAKGCEPDTAFYIQNESFVRGKNDIDLSNDPPPDLVIEVDVTSPSLNKLPIYAAIGIAEIWIYKGKYVEFLKLVGEDYRKINQSIALPMLSDEKATEFLENGLIESSTKWIKKIREWSKDK